MTGARAAGPLQRFQDEFARALLVEDCAAAGIAPEIARLAAQPAFAVYRNTVMKGCIDALQANYPSIARLVGEEWFRAAAALYARSNLPRHPTLADYGADFVGFLAAFAPAADLPYLPGVARLDRFWTEAHTAHDEPPLDRRHGRAPRAGRARANGAAAARVCPLGVVRRAADRDDLAKQPLPGCRRRRRASRGMARAC